MILKIVFCDELSEQSRKVLWWRLNNRMNRIRKKIEIPRYWNVWNNKSHFDAFLGVSQSENFSTFLRGPNIPP